MHQFPCGDFEAAKSIITNVQFISKAARLFECVLGASRSSEIRTRCFLAGILLIHEKTGQELLAKIQSSMAALYQTMVKLGEFKSLAWHQYQMTEFAKQWDIYQDLFSEWKSQDMAAMKHQLTKELAHVEVLKTTFDNVSCENTRYEWKRVLECWRCDLMGWAQQIAGRSLSSRMTDARIIHELCLSIRTRDLFKRLKVQTYLSDSKVLDATDHLIRASKICSDLKLLSGYNKNLEREVSQVLDLCAQLSSVGRMELENLVRKLLAWAIEFMGRTCAPVRDHQIRTCRQAMATPDLKSVYKYIFETLDDMKQDHIYFLCAHAQPSLEDHAKRIELEEFLNHVQSHQTLADKKYWQKHSVIGRTKDWSSLIDKMLRAFVCGEPVVLPETLYLDIQTLEEWKIRIERTATLLAIISADMYRSADRSRSFDGLVPVLLESPSNRWEIVLAKTSIWSESFKHTLAGVFSERGKPLVDLFRQRISDQIRQWMQHPGSPTRSYLLPLKQEISIIAAQLSVLSSLHKHVYGDVYQHVFECLFQL